MSEVHSYEASKEEACSGDLAWGRVCLQMRNLDEEDNFKVLKKRPQYAIELALTLAELKKEAQLNDFSRQALSQFAQTATGELTQNDFDHWAERYLAQRDLFANPGSEEAQEPSNRPGLK